MAQQGSLYVVGSGADSACYLKYRSTDETGNSVHKTVFLCKRDDVHDWWFKRGKWGFSSSVRDLQRETMDVPASEGKLTLRVPTVTFPLL